MTPEIDTARMLLRSKISEILAALEDLGQNELNHAPDLPGANSPFVIATHVFGNMRAWVLGIACGQGLRRDRPAEFRSRGKFDDLALAAQTLTTDISRALEGLDPATLDDRIVPSQELFGEGQVREVSRREALLHPLEHAGIHLGHIHMTVTLLRSGA